MTSCSLQREIRKLKSKRQKLLLLQQEIQEQIEKIDREVTGLQKEIKGQDLPDQSESEEQKYDQESDAIIEEDKEDEDEDEVNIPPVEYQNTQEQKCDQESDVIIEKGTEDQVEDEIEVYAPTVEYQNNESDEFVEDDVDHEEIRIQEEDNELPNEDVEVRINDQALNEPHIESNEDVGVQENIDIVVEENVIVHQQPQEEPVFDQTPIDTQYRYVPLEEQQRHWNEPTEITQSLLQDLQDLEYEASLIELKDLPPAFQIEYCIHFEEQL